MQNYNIFVDETSDTSYQISLIPSRLNGGAVGTKSYSTKDAFIGDLQRVLGYTDKAIVRFFASEDRQQTLMNYALSDENAAYLGYLPALDVVA